MTQRRLEAPHRRLESSPSRPVEKAAIIGYKLTAAVLAHVPPRLSRWVIGRANQAVYLAWPAKRRYSNINFSHVLGLPPEHPDVRRLAMRAYREYAAYVVELMRLPSRPADEIANAVGTEGIDDIIARWRGSGGPVIIAAGHVGNNEAVAAGIARHGYPISVVADDSSFPELFELLRQQRESWGVKVVPWRNLRGLFGVLRNNEILALLVDWGYKPDGIPVKLFDAWTTLPAGPATLAAKTNGMIIPITIRRQPGGRFTLIGHEPIRVASTTPADLQRATQAIADALEATIASAPEQWYSFKPCWPADPAEAVELEARAMAMLAGSTGAAPAAAAPAAASPAVVPS